MECYDLINFVALHKLLLVKMPSPGNIHLRNVFSEAEHYRYNVPGKLSVVDIFWLGYLSGPKFLTVTLTLPSITGDVHAFTSYCVDDGLTRMIRNAFMQCPRHAIFTIHSESPLKSRPTGQYSNSISTTLQKELFRLRTDCMHHTHSATLLTLLSHTGLGKEEK